MAPPGVCHGYCVAPSSVQCMSYRGGCSPQLYLRSFICVCMITCILLLRSINDKIYDFVVVCVVLYRSIIYFLMFKQQN